MAIFRDRWEPTDNYTAGDLVNFSGVVYEALGTITGSANALTPNEDTMNWQVSYVERVESLVSIVEVVRQELNVDDEDINNSVVEYVHRGSEYVRQRLRPPTNLVSAILKTESIPGEDYEGRIYVRIPGDLLQVENIRINHRTASGYGLVNQGILEIKAAQSEQNFETVHSYYNQDNSIYGVRDVSNFSTPVYRFRTIGGISYFEITPAQIGIGTDIELVYWKSEPQLGTQHPRVNSMGDPLNSSGQTLQQFLADNTVGHTVSTASFTLPTGSLSANSNVEMIITLRRPGLPDRVEGVEFPLQNGATRASVASDMLADLNTQWSPAITWAGSGLDGATITGTSESVGHGTQIFIEFRVFNYFVGGNEQANPVVTLVAGGPPFVQEQVRIESNWYSNNAPYCIVYAALFHASAWLKDNERSSMWKGLYTEEESRVEDMIYRFQEDRPTDQQMFSPYSL